MKSRLDKVLETTLFEIVDELLWMGLGYCGSLAGILVLWAFLNYIHQWPMSLFAICLVPGYLFSRKSRKLGIIPKVLKRENRL